MVARGYRELHRVTIGYWWLQRVTTGHKGLQGLQEVTGGYIGL